MSINQNVPQLRGGRHQQRLPADRRLRQQQPVPLGRRVDLSRAAAVVRAKRPAAWGHYRASYTLSKAENNVGEFFFSGPIDPFDLSKDWSRADNDRRHALVVSARRELADGAGRDAPGARLTHGFQLSALVQAYSAAPFNITSGVTTVQGTAGRPIVDGAVHPAQLGRGRRVLQP